MPVPRDGLQHAYAVALGVHEGDITTHAGYLHGLAEDAPARLRYLRDRISDIIDLFFPSEAG